MRYFPIILLMFVTACEYPDIEIGQYDVQLARTFIWEQGDFINGQYKTTNIDTVMLGPTCLIGCYETDSAVSLTLINYVYPDTLFLDTSWTWTYTEPK